jgi:AcrR family transcriptional regulator
MPDKTVELTRDKERQILDAAQKRFAVFGLTKVTMDEIAADLGMGKASLYYYFSTKEELFRAVILREQKEFLLRIQEIARQKIAVADKLKRYTDQRLIYFGELLNLHLLGIHSWLNTKPLFRELFESFAAEEEKYLAGLLREGNKSGEFLLSDPEATAKLLLHILQGMRMRVLRAAQVDGVPAAAQKELAAEMGQLIELVLNGIRKSKSRS